MKNLTIIVKGSVQGVFYRASARDAARQLGIKGFARNETNGNVLIQAEGEADALEKFVAWCKKGPPRATVDEVTVEEKDLMNFTSFEIKR